MELGISTFAETTAGPSGKRMPAAQRLGEVVREAVAAEAAGLDVYAVGEHHRVDYAASAPAVVLAAIAAQTERIRLSSAVTVLSSDDPVRVYESFATLDLLSGGRAEIMAGRGSFTESFPLFGYDLDDYEELFAEKLELLLEVRDNEVVTWSGRQRPALDRAGVYPRALQRPLPVWVAVGGTPASVVRAGALGLPLALAIIGGEPARFAPLVELYRESARRAGHDPAGLPVAVHLHGFVADTTQAADAAFYEPYATAMTVLGRERGWPAMTPERYQALRAQGGSLAVGSPAEVAEKLGAVRSTLGIDRVLLHPSVGTVEHGAVIRSIELLGGEVAAAL
ncbi:MAG TPA: Atu2307/SP_0267 family LLM class monooxygenase, partial [Solirubrobacteraceae bacterium]|nr:Atu2307/SP_0267 family LLM class monooxygenase [Solirubrobacteraceae bacterium]